MSNDLHHVKTSLHGLVMIILQYYPNTSAVIILLHEASNLVCFDNDTMHVFIFAYVCTYIIYVYIYIYIYIYIIYIHIYIHIHIQATVCR